MDGRRRRSCARSAATPERFDITGVLAATVPSGAAAVAALRDDPRVAYIERDPALRWPSTSSTRSTRRTGIKFTWAYDTVRAGEAIAAVGGGSSRRSPWSTPAST